VDLKGCELKPEQVQIDRNIVEVVARRLIVLDTASDRDKKSKPEPLPTAE
jgi:hypothetical protein